MLYIVPPSHDTCIGVSLWSDFVLVSMCVFMGGQIGEPDGTRPLGTIAVVFHQLS